MEIYSYWFLLALTLLAMEMATGTFYMLVLAIAMAVGGLAAWLSAGMAWQLILCALVMIAGAMIIKFRKTSPEDEAVSLDVGQPVQVLEWFDNGFARVSYRGAEWDAEPDTADMSRNGIFYIKELRGSSLILTHNKPQH